MSVTTSLPSQKARTTVQNIGLILAFIVLGSILLLPTPETLSTGGHRMIGVLAFAIILWMTSAVSSGKCDHDYGTHSLVTRLLSKSRGAHESYGHS